jgi:hypothetical protein
MLDPLQVESPAVLFTLLTEDPELAIDDRHLAEKN